MRLQLFTTSLIAEGKTTALLHGFLSFFKHLFADFSLPKGHFNEWRIFFKELLSTCLEVNGACAGLLSNNRLTGDGEDIVDSRGHPIADKA